MHIPKRGVVIQNIKMVYMVSEIIDQTPNGLQVSV